MGGINILCLIGLNTKILFGFVIIGMGKGVWNPPPPPPPYGIGLKKEKNDGFTTLFIILSNVKQ